MRIVLADDHPIFTESLALLLQTIPGVEIVGVVHNGTDLPGLLGRTKADIVICDMYMPGLSGIETTKLVSTGFPGVRVLILSVTDEIHLIREAVLAGAAGYLSKKVKLHELEMALRQLAAGESFFKEEHLRQLVLAERDPTRLKGLSKREIEVIRLIAEELSNHAIADKLYISVNTVESHRKNIYRKTGVNNTGGLIKFAIRNKLVRSG